jgi:hypothetical protein
MSWSATPLPREVVDAVRPVARRLVEQIVAAVRSENPVYDDVLVSPEGIGIRLGIDQAIESFLDAVERGERPRAATSETWRRLGESEFQAGRSLEALRAAWRTGTRAAWRGAAELASEAGVPTPFVIALAEAIFVFTDELGTEVIEGYLRIQSDEAGEQERRRRRLAALLLDSDGHDPEAITHAAQLARWRVPASVALLALPGERPGAVARRLDLEVLVGSDQAGSFLVVPDPDGPGRTTALRRAVGSHAAALGPTVPPRDAHRSLRWARLALEVVGAEGGLIHAVDHLATLILHSEEELARAFADRRLRPIIELPARERDRLLGTLRAWLDHQRHTPAVAAELHVHPQTVRYRIASLRELLGDALETPDGRFELQMALRIRAA